MKSANAYGSPSSAAHRALCGEEPSSHGSGRSGRPGSVCGQAREGMVDGQPLVEVPEQLLELLREVVGARLAAVALQGERGQRVGAGGAPEREVDASGEQAGEQAEGLRDLQRRVVREHHPAAADADPLGGRGDRPDQGLGARPGEHRPAVVLGHPVAVVAEPVRELREVDRVAQRLRARGALGDGGLVEHREAEGRDGHRMQG